MRVRILHHCKEMGHLEVKDIDGIARSLPQVISLAGHILVRRQQRSNNEYYYVWAPAGVVDFTESPNLLSSELRLPAEPREAPPLFPTALPR
jgi:hypothetical protein